VFSQDIPAVAAVSEQMPNQPFPAKEFADVLAANAKYETGFENQHLTGTAAKGLAIITCMDSRISPLAIVGMSPGDVKILRNAGARVTDDVLRTLVLATFLLGVNRILVMPHTDCRMASASESEIHDLILKEHDVDTRSVEFRTVTDQAEALLTDVMRIRTYPLMAKGVTVAGAIFDVHTGKLKTFDY
jgi:carbonic anhydrase